MGGYNHGQVPQDGNQGTVAEGRCTVLEEGQWHPAGARRLSSGGTGGSFDRQYLASAGHVDKTVKLSEVATGQELRTIKGHTGAVLSAAFSLDSQRVVSISADHTIKLWHVSSGLELFTLQSGAGQWDALGKVELLGRPWRSARMADTWPQAVATGRYTSGMGHPRKSTCTIRCESSQ